MAEKASGAAKPIHISDVAKPGKSAPSASAKPIIVTNRPVLKDPMMVDEADNKPDEQSTNLPLNHLKISPITDDDTAQAPVAEDSASKASETSSVGDESEATTDADKAADTSEATDDAEDNPSPKTDAAKAKSDEASDQAAADLRAKELDDLTVSRKYYLPINQVEKRKAKRYAWAGILLIVLLAVAWADIAADAGIINLPVKPVTHFFSK